MTIDEMKARIAELEALSTEVRNKIQSNTDAARKLNADNRVLMDQRRTLQKEQHDLEHQLRKAEKEAQEQPE